MRTSITMTTRWLRRLLAHCAVLQAVAGIPAGAEGSHRLDVAEPRSLEAEARLVIDLLQNHHYTGKALRNLASSQLLSHHLAALDPQALFLTGEDAEYVYRRFGRSLKSVYLFKGDLRPAAELFELFRKRVGSRLAWIDRRLQREFDLAARGQADFGWTAPPKDNAEADQRWELILTERVLLGVLSGRDQAAARAAVRSALHDWADSLTARDALAVRELFLDSIIRAFDPHSGYFSADTATEFEVEMDGAVTGIGAKARLAEGKCVVTRVEPGGAADLQSDLRAGDVLVAIANAGGERIELGGRPLGEITSLVRGAPGSRLVLYYRREPDSALREAHLERIRFVEPGQRARGGISSVPGGRGRRIGYVALPQFYASPGEPPETSAARDVRELVDRMVAAGIDGLVLDLRDNPGGHLREALERFK